MNDEDILALFNPFYLDFVNLAAISERPLLAHYTSIESLEKIVTSDEIWFSSPLFMNDLQEMIFGLREGRQIFESMLSDPEFMLKLGSTNRANVFRNAFFHYFSQFDQEQALDVYVFCLAEHDPELTDGLLSMWRGYGGRGSGAALVFRSDFVTVRQDSPLLIAKVVYASESKRREWLQRLCNFVRDNLFDTEIADEKLYILAYGLFQSIKLYSLLTKHPGFSEEREWRIIYLPDRDVNHMLSGNLTYVVGQRGVEPKLRFPIKPLPFEDANSWTFEGILDRIILGPSLASWVATNSIRKMFQAIGKPDFSAKIVASGIPLRPSS